MTRGEEIFNQILEASAVIVDQDVVIYPSCCPPEGSGKWEGDEENEVLYLGWEIEGLGYSATFTEKNLEDAVINDDGTITLQDNDSDESTQIQLLVPKQFDLYNNMEKK